MEEEWLSLANRLENCYTGAVYDVLREMGIENRTLSSQMRPINISSKLAGRIFTVSGHYNKLLDPHETLLKWTGFLSKAPRNHVIICQPNDHAVAHMGELSAETLLLKGVRGYIVDGGCRDSDFIEKVGFKVFCKYYSPADIVGCWTPDILDQTIIIDGITIQSGDYVLADRDGVVIIPGTIVETVITRTENVMRKENLVRKAILSGVDPQVAYLEYGIF
ncbi:RraA family protein [Flavobacteriaceae bacterium F89]|uniref:Putative 4-hydroxy-4-methyl-2-oxoglutarate aldolase n=1 Tax=Cerina litoralis TaxID=2874477 RepID=A0AAE3EXT0_9FLAO|nr:RraA family protein [Cerina litoralis]MCG2462228.1 RraA family protein [Cerina litoralis]